MGEPHEAASGGIYSTDLSLMCGTNLGDQCEGEVGDRNTLTLVADPLPGSTFNVWEVKIGDANPVTKTGRVLTQVVTSDMTVSAKFLTIKVGGTFYVSTITMPARSTDETGYFAVGDARGKWAVTLSEARKLLNLTWTCSDGSSRSTAVPFSTVAKVKFDDLLPATPFPPFGTCKITLVLDNSGGNQPKLHIHEQVFFVRVARSGLGRPISYFTESDLHVEGIVSLHDGRIYQEVIPIDLAPGDVWKVALPQTDYLPTSFPYVFEAEGFVRGGDGSGVVLCAIGFIFPSSSVIHVGAQLLHADAIIDPGDSQSKLMKRVFNIYRGQDPPRVVMVCKNVGTYESATVKRHVEGPRRVFAGPVTANFVPQDTTAVAVAENKFVTNLIFANAVPVKAG
eukprot:CAMPEP_0177637130 /NCGR_PEP_ID=MMETSP0447-20121125/4807_1 /TAXON_ID=0 /ORGANISM="Stygamoeba regulata, Strain BSH-02190019" /LENGTH=394 /DNA_ID=CAMNT_0019139037 /DNA_START=114 /DNA_END=1298 /DNA_ORIENTATION=+